jgi:hypothetical protein
MLAAQKAGWSENLLVALTAFPSAEMKVRSTADPSECESVKQMAELTAPSLVLDSAATKASQSAVK